jgi:hypothetical protein
MSATNKPEVFRITPQVGKFYDLAEWTEKTGSSEEENVRYFATEQPRYIGQLIDSCYLEYKKDWFWELKFKDNADQIISMVYNSINRMAFREVADTKPGRVEVFRQTPKVGKFYEYAECTEKIGSYSNGNQRYFTTNPLRYVGEYIRHEQCGGGDGADHWAIFDDDNGKEIRIEYSYEGNTCFKEVIIV